MGKLHDKNQEMKKFEKRKIKEKSCLLGLK